jgi:hypothetical protein
MRTTVAWRRQVTDLYDKTCRHCANPIMIYGGVWFTMTGAECGQSSDTQHRPIGAAVPERKPAAARAVRPRPVPEVLSGVARPPAPHPTDHERPLPASVVARGASTQALADSAGRRNRGLR